MSAVVETRPPAPDRYERRAGGIPLAKGQYNRRGVLAGQVLVAGGQSGLLVLGHEETRVDHAERLEELLSEVVVEALPREDLDQAAPRVGREPVVPVRARVELERVLAQECE